MEDRLFENSAKNDYGSLQREEKGLHKCVHAVCHIATTAHICLYACEEKTHVMLSLSLSILVSLSISLSLSLPVWECGWSVISPCSASIVAVTVKRKNSPHCITSLLPSVPPLCCFRTPEHSTEPVTNPQALAYRETVSQFLLNGQWQTR